MKKKTGDIITFEDRTWKGNLMWKHTRPKTREIHGATLGDYIKELDDWVIMETIISKQASVSLLRYHHVGETYHIYRNNDPDIELKGEQIVAEFYKRARVPYDHEEIVRFALYCVADLARGRYPLQPNKFAYWENGKMWCWELVHEIRKAVGGAFIPADVRPSPWSAKRAQIDGRIYEVEDGHVLAVKDEVRGRLLIPNPVTM